MKILNITSFEIFPPDTGAANGVYRFLKYLSKIHQIILLTVQNKSNFNNDLKIKLYDVLGNTKLKKFLNPLVFIKILKVVKKEKPQMIILDCPWLGIYVFILSKFYQIPYVLHQHNIEYLRFKRFHQWWWWILKYYEKFVCQQASQIFCKTKNDKHILNQSLNINDQKIQVVPYGVDTEIFKPDLKKGLEIRKKLGLKNTPMILFFGKLDYYPNVEVINIIKTQLLPKLKRKLPKLKVVIVGKNQPEKIKDKAIIYTGSVLNMADYINACDGVIVPLKVGGGIRTKIIESIACGKTVISTNLGAEGIDKKVCQNKLIITNNWLEFTNQIIRLINQPKKNYVPKGFIQQYDWENIINKLVI